jgi:hypothetical protein
MKSVSRLAPVALVAALVLSGCGGGDGGDSADDNPTSAGGAGSSTATDGGSTSTDGGSETAASTPQPGDELVLGETAPLRWDPKESLQGDVDVTVERIDRSTMKDFAAFNLKKDVKASTPYYVHVKVKNNAATDLGGVELPVYLDNGSDVLFPSARIESSFKPCPNRTLPEKFKKGKQADLCLVFLAAKNTKLEAVAMRPTEQTEPITWTGKITRPAKDKKG